MLFKDIKYGSPVYVLDRNALEVYTGKVVNTPQQHMDSQQPIGFNSMQGQLVVDIAIEHNGSRDVYVLPDSAEVGYAGNIVIATSQDIIIREIEAIRAQDEQVLSTIDARKANVDKCKTLLEELNPIYREKANTEARFKSIETNMSDIAEKIELLLQKLS